MLLRFESGINPHMPLGHQQAQFMIKNLKRKSNPLDFIALKVQKQNLMQKLQESVQSKMRKMNRRLEMEQKANVYGFNMQLLQSPTSVSMINSTLIKNANVSQMDALYHVVKKRRNIQLPVLNTSLSTSSFQGAHQIQTKSIVLNTAEDSSQERQTQALMSSNCESAADPNFPLTAQSRQMQLVQSMENLPVDPHLLKNEVLQQRLQSIRYKQRPQARDGHTGIVYQGLLLVFGGDRHHMPFNDTYVLDLARELRQRGLKVPNEYELLNLSMTKSS
mmetsp:Transcript_12376/g.20792  ORF Transcript_12376/g.20792 Transcript_12376/m.20792 type:complete len:276 (-) Transcript_12376:66-893(-)